MKHVILVILSTYLILIGQSFAQIASLDELANENLCEKLSELRKEEDKKDLKKAKKLRRQLIASQFFPKKYFKPSILKKPVSSKYLSKSAQQRGIILSIGKNIKDSKVVSQLENQLKDFQKLSRSFLKLLQSKSVKKCESKRLKSNFNLNNYKKQKETVSKNKELVQYNEYKQIKSTVDNFLKTSKKSIHWSVSYNVHFDQIHSVLQSGEYHHVVLILHGSNTGMLVDSFGNYLPNKLFETSHVNIGQLAVFSCYSEDVNNKYKITKNFLENGSIFENRKIVSVESKLVVQDNKTMIKALRPLLKSIKPLVFNREGAKPVSSKNCSIDYKTDLISGNLGLFVNDKHYLGLISNHSGSISIPCGYIMSGNKLSLRKLDGIEPEFTHIDLKSQSIQIKLKKHYKSNGEYFGSLYLID